MKTKLLTLLFTLQLSVNCFSQNISTYAGNGTMGSSGDGGLATSAQIIASTPDTFIAFDNYENLYISSAGTQRIRKVDKNTNIITTIVGTGIEGFSGDNGLATNANIGYPLGIIFDASNNLYFIDTANQRIRKVEYSTGIITTIAGNGIYGFSGDEGLAINASFANMVQLKFDNLGNLYIADRNNDRIRKITKNTNVVTTVVGNGLFGFSGDGGLATSAQLNEPTDIDFDSLGNLYIADYQNSKIRKVNISGIISTYSDNPVNNIIVDGAGNLFCSVYNISNDINQILKIDTSGNQSIIVASSPSGFSGDGGLAISAQFYHPTALAIDNNGNLFITDMLNRRIRKISNIAIAPLYATTTQNNVSCNGGTNGNSSVTASGGTVPYTYSWSPSGGTGTTATGLAAGTYTCTVTDSSSNSIVKTITITESSAITTTGTQTNVSCNGGSDGTATITVSGGTPQYTYSWSPSGGTNTTAAGLSAGTYICTIMDSNSCEKTKNFTITQPTAITATKSYTNATCWNYSNGSASVNPSGGGGSYTYLWSPYGETWATIDAEAGNYTCTITDANGCSIQKNFTITQPTALDLGITANQNLLTANQSSGVTYQWNYCNGGAISGATQQTYTATAVGSYELVMAMISNSDCEYTTTCVTVTTLSTNDFDLINKLKLYPNPAQNQVTIGVNELTNISLQILDINGRVLQTKKLDNTSNIINVENLQAGVYLFKIASNEGTTTQRVVKK